MLGARFLLSSLFLSLALSMPASACLQPPGGDALRHEALLWINQERGRVGLTAFRPSPVLDRAAQRHACDNAAHNRMSHTGSDGSWFGERIQRAGYSYRRATENVALGYRDARSVVAAWMRSPSHRQNVLDRGTHELGLGLARGRDGRLHWVMVSGRR
ncbi:CAP domain-containing protein [Pararhodobacter sp. SW119]|uniref:CAP domain-containing protein n=1 Tax=Pararhodobacter sp. SW119 TaxID=2780075 RepID=UPI001ADEC6CE|nr:CAP domain-containing protein [Pararhodobacter sp. SW119]